MIIKFGESFRVLLTLVIFIALTVIAAVNYSGDKAKENLSQGAMYRMVANIAKGAQFFVNRPAEIITDNNREQINEKSRFIEKVSNYIKVDKTEEGLQITLQNSRGVILQKTF